MSKHITSANQHVIPTFLRLALRVVMRVRYFGTKYGCPMCGSYLRTFKPFGLELPALREHEVVGGGRRENALCPVCGSLDRERLVYLYLTRVAGIGGQALRLLHVAPEAALSRYLQGLDGLDYLTADFHAGNVMVRMDITEILYPDGHFDAIICNHVLEHIPDDRRAMAELYRVLAPCGWAILQVPMSKRLATTFEDAAVSSEADRERVFGQKDHVRIYAADYVDRLRSTGFEVEVVRWWEGGSSLGELGNRHALLQDEELFIARKPVSTATGKRAVEWG